MTRHHHRQSPHERAIKLEAFQNWLHVQDRERREKSEVRERLP